MSANPIPEAVRAWETEDGRVISASQKETALRDGGASASSVAVYSIPLYTAADLSQQPEPKAEARGVVDGWKPASVEPPHDPKNGSLGTEYLIFPPTSRGDRTAFYGRRLGGAACWYRYGAQVHGVDYWQELPASPAALAGERNG
jgi:hypothetical protein